jgi:hypothetical protein
MKFADVKNDTEDEGLKSAYEEAIQNQWSKEELDAYDYRYMREEDSRAEIDAATQKGKMEQKIAIAKGMKKEGFENSLISRLTGLSEKKIDEL